MKVFNIAQFHAHESVGLYVQNRCLTTVAGAKTKPTAASSGSNIERPWALLRAVQSGLVYSTLMLSALFSVPGISLADEGGVSFWVPGLFGSLAATPQQPGWSLATIYYNTTISAGGNVALAREFEIRNIPVNLQAQISASLHASGNLGFVIPSYVFATPVLGGQASASLLTAYGQTNASLMGTISGTVGPIPFGPRTDSIGDTTTGPADLIPQFAVRWNAGLSNYMAYMTGDIPVGTYSSSNLTNVGIGHGAIDAGGGYTYFNPKTGQELSGVLGFTYNMTNPSTQYQNGVDMHFDWGASQFVTKQLQLGLVGYAYKEIGCDSGSGDLVGCFQSQVLGVGPQVGYVFPIGGMQGYLNLKAYGEFAGADRPTGWNAWLTFVLSPAAPAPAAPPRSMITK
jgi:hypothetical protein